MSEQDEDAKLESYARRMQRKWDVLKSYEAEEDEEAVSKAVAAARAAKRYDRAVFMFFNQL